MTHAEKKKAKTKTGCDIVPSISSFFKCIIFKNPGKCLLSKLTGTVFFIQIYDVPYLLEDYSAVYHFLLHHQHYTWKILCDWRLDCHAISIFYPTGIYIQRICALVTQTGQFNPNRGFCLVDTLDLCDSFHSSVFCLPLICLLCITCWILNCQYLFQASPILIGGRQAFVEEKKTTSRGKFLFACAIG